MMGQAAINLSGFYVHAVLFLSNQFNALFRSLYM